MSRIFITGDTHGDIDRLKLKKIRKDKSLTLEDTVIIAGDWGVFWGPSDYYDKEEKFLLDWYGRFPCTVLVLDGNHDNHDKFNSLPEGFIFGNDVGIISNNIYHLRRGRIYNIGGRSFFIFGGALSIDKLDRIIGISWWPEELASKEQRDRAYSELDNINWKVDYVVTHTAPKSIIKALDFDAFEAGAKYNDPTCSFLEDIKNQLSFNKWFFGHFHVDKTLEKGKYIGVFNQILEVSH